MSEIDNREIATFANGCFWCTEVVFQQLKGVDKVSSGYAGGHVENPRYDQVLRGNTGHAECLNIEFNPTENSFDELLEVFRGAHDPATLNTQGNDVGAQYRSVIFHHNQGQKESAEKYKKELERSGVFDRPIVTRIEPFTTFYPAELVHADYYKNNPEQSYYFYVIKPKLDKLKKVFSNKLKPVSG